MTTLADRAEGLRGATDLYAALRAAARGLSLTDAGSALEVWLGALGDSPEAGRLRAVDQGLLRAVIHKGAGLAAVPGAGPAVAALRRATVAPLFRPEIADAPRTALPTTGARADMPAFSDRAFDRWFAATGAVYGLGLYGERRSVYTAPQFADAASPERRKIHLGVDVFAAAGTEVHAPLPGRVAEVAYNADPLDYGHTLILEHDLDGARLFTLYGHLGGSLSSLCRRGDTVAGGQVVAHLGDWHENGGWAPHLHFQIITDRLDQTGGNFFGVGHESLWDVWSEISPDANLILRLPEASYRF